MSKPSEFKVGALVELFHIDVVNTEHTCAGNPTLSRHHKNAFKLKTVSGLKFVGFSPSNEYCSEVAGVDVLQSVLKECERKFYSLAFCMEPFFVSREYFNEFSMASK